VKGMDMNELKSRIPPDWRARPSDSGGGEVFEDPRNYGRNIRVMPGYAKGVRADPINHGPYVVVSQNGDKFKVALAGNPTLK